jgi:hypothetical protein
MHYTLTITADSPAELVALLQPRMVGMAEASGALASPQAAPAVTTAPAPAVTTDNDNDDDDGPVNTSAGEFDKRGLPWDERIHASTKAVNADGSWRYRRGVGKELIAQVEAEIHDKVLDIPTFLRRDPTPADTAPAVAAPEQAPAAAPIPVPTGAPVEAGPTAPAITYERVIQMMTEALQGGKLTPASLPEFWSEIGVAGAAQMVGNQPAIEAAYAKLALL